MLFYINKLFQIINIGALDKTVLIWKIPQQLISQNILMNNLKYNRKKVSKT